MNISDRKNRAVNRTSVLESTASRSVGGINKASCKAICRGLLNARPFSKDEDWVEFDVLLPKLQDVLAAVGGSEAALVAWQIDDASALMQTGASG
jgi:hypothetical protein